MSDKEYQQSEMADLDLDSLAEETVPDGHKSGIVAVAGRPNVGKSTLMNAFLRQKIAIVSPRPQTTRNNQLGILTEADYQIIFVDTPGIIRPRQKLDEYMVAAANDSIRDADVVLWLVDAGDAPGAGDKAIAATLERLRKSVPVILVLNKGDLVPAEIVITRTDDYRALLLDAGWILISALHRDGLDALLSMIVDQMPEGPRYYPMDQTTDLYVRDLAAELIREQLYLQMREELPYGSAVLVDEFKERDNGVTYIKATIYVERENHKKMVIGTKGSQLRRIGAAARKEIEALIEGKVYLELWVKVEPQWRSNEESLKRLGYN
jgi:GTP-binding protein Era